MTTHVNCTPFSTLVFETLDHRDREYHVAVIRATCDLTDGGELRPAAAQTPVAAADQYFGEPTLSGLRWESDLAPYKPRCDILLEATAYAPKGTPAPGWPVDIRVGTHRKRLLVTGPRRWQRKLFGGWKTPLPEPIANLPLRYDYAYGGQVTRYDPESEREHTDHCPHNPLGVGYWPPWAHQEAKRRDQIPIPQLLAVEDVQPEFGRPLRVQGVGPTGKTWLPRIDLAGTYDEPWQAGRWPKLPEDFDFGFWNCAHPDLRIPYPAGDEKIELYNLTPRVGSNPGCLAIGLWCWCVTGTARSRRHVPTWIPCSSHPTTGALAWSGGPPSWPSRRCGYWNHTCLPSRGPESRRSEDPPWRIKKVHVSRANSSS